MYKLVRHVPAVSRRFIFVSQSNKGPCSMLLLRSRQMSNDSDPKRPKKSHPMLWGLAGALVGATATIIYAKNNSDFRDWLVDNAPWADNIVAVVYQEQMPIDQWAQKKISSAGDSVYALLFGKEDTIVEKRLVTTDKPQAKFGPQTYDLPPPPLASCYVEEKKVDKPEVPPTKVILAEPVAAPVEKPVQVAKDLVALEKCVRDSTKAAIDNYMKAVDACMQYNRDLNKIIEASVEEIDRKKMDNLRVAQNARKEACQAAAKADKEANAAMEELSKELKSGENAPVEAVMQTNRQLAKFRCDLKAARDEFLQCEENACVADRYWNRVEQARTAYLDQLSVLLPGVDVQSKKLSMEGGDADILLMHTLKQVLSLQREIAEAQTVRESRLKRAIESRDDKELIEAKAKEMLAAEKLKLEQCYNEKLTETTARLEKQRREDMKKQLDIHEAHLADRLEAKEKEVRAKFDALVDETVEKQKLVFAEQVATLKAKLQAIQERVVARARADEAQRRAQSLWAAGESLLSATRRGAGGGVTRVDTEIKAVEKAGGNDSLVQTVVKGISPEAREKGLLSENELREYYNKMEKTALRVALVQKDGAPLPVYLLSYLQSLLVCTRVSDIPKSELDNQPTDFSSMDAFDILQRARYHMERNDIASALKYVNLLQGASKTAAASWRDAAIRHLEIKQAAEAVMAHAAASALGS